jgi:hypothetical protein
MFVKRPPDFLLNGGHVRARLAIATVLAWSLPASTGALAQSTGAVAGRVVNENGSPLGQSIVHLLVEGGGAVTDSAGRFVMNAVPAGDRVLAAQMIGYDTDVAFVRVEAGDTSRVLFRLAERRFPFSGADDPVPGIELTSIATTLIPAVLRDTVSLSRLRNSWPDLQDGDTLVVVAPWMVGQDLIVIENGVVLRVTRECASCVGRASVAVEGGAYYVAATRHVRLGLRSSGAATPNVEFCVGPARPGITLFGNCAGPSGSFAIRYFQRSPGDWVRIDLR